MRDVDREYRRHRRSAYTGIFVGYAGYYLVRNTLALAIPDILKEFPQHSKADLGWALTGLSLSYGVSKFLMGSVSDRSNPKYFLPLGLLLSCGIMAASRRLQGDVRLARPRHPPAGCQRVGAGHGLAAIRQDDGALVQHEGARARRVVLERRPQRRRRSGRDLCGARRRAVSRLGREAVRQRRDCRGHRDSRVRPDARHAGVVRLAAGRGLQERLSARLHGRAGAQLQLPRNLRRARAEQSVLVGDCRRQRVRLLRAVWRGELDSDLPANGERASRSTSRAPAGRSTNSPPFPAPSPAGGSPTKSSPAAARRRRSCSCR